MNDDQRLFSSLPPDRRERAAAAWKRTLEQAAARGAQPGVQLPAEPEEAPSKWVLAALDRVRGRRP